MGLEVARTQRETLRQNARLTRVPVSRSLRRRQERYLRDNGSVGAKVRDCVAGCLVACIYDGGDQYLINPEEMKSHITKAARFDFSEVEPG